MAHGDALIFLTNITWVFVLFIILYLFFVIYFLPTFYKKFRIRSLVRSKLNWAAAISVQNVFSGIIFFVDSLKEFGARVLLFFTASFKVLKFSNNLNLSIPTLSGFGSFGTVGFGRYFSKSASESSLIFLKLTLKK